MGCDAPVPDNIQRLLSPLETPLPDGDDFYAIGEVTSLVGMSAYTLRWYERIGLLGDIQRDSRQQRVFRNQDLEWLRFISRLRLTGMSVEDMAAYANYLRQGVGHAASASHPTDETPSIRYRTNGTTEVHFGRPG